MKQWAVFKTKNDSFGHINRFGGLEITTHTTNAIQNLTIPTTHNKLRSFNDLCNMLRRYVSNFTFVSFQLKARLQMSCLKKVGYAIKDEPNALRTVHEKCFSPPALSQLTENDDAYYIWTRSLCKWEEFYCKRKVKMPVGKVNIGRIYGTTENLTCTLLTASAL